MPRRGHHLIERTRVAAELHSSGCSVGTGDIQLVGGDALALIQDFDSEFVILAGVAEHIGDDHGIFDFAQLGKLFINESSRPDILQPDGIEHAGWCLVKPRRRIPGHRLFRQTLDYEAADFVQVDYIFEFNSVTKSAAGGNYRILEFDAGKGDGKIRSASSSGGGGGHRDCSVSRGGCGSKVFARVRLAPASCRLSRGHPALTGGGETPPRQPPGRRRCNVACIGDHLSVTVFIPMLDLNFVRDNLPLVEEKLRQRGMKPAEVLKNFAQVDAQRRQAITSAETMKAQRNRASEEIAKLKKSGQDAGALIAETKNLREQVEQLGKAAEEYETRLQQILVGIPNLPHASVPVGKGADDNVEIRRWGTPPKFDFAPKPHWEIGEHLGVLDLERAAKLSGARFAVYWDLGARLERALANFMLDLQTREHGYTEVLPPYLVNSDSMYGTGQLPKFAADSFRVPHGDKDLWL